jgi:2-dehydro-3-deoxygluconokinase
MAIPLRDPSQRRNDLISLGEIGLRFDPGKGRIHCTREYNFTRGLCRSFDQKTTVCPPAGRAKILFSRVE